MRTEDDSSQEGSPTPSPTPSPTKSKVMTPSSVASATPTLTPPPTPTREERVNRHARNAISHYQPALSTMISSRDRIALCMQHDSFDIICI